MALLPSYALMQVLTYIMGAGWAGAAHMFLCKSERWVGAWAALLHIATAVVTLIAGKTYYSRQVVLVVIVCTWAVRLGVHVTWRYHRRLQESSEPAAAGVSLDTRFDNMRDVPASTFIFFSMMAAWTFMVQLPVIVSNGIRRDHPLGYIDYIGWGIWAVGLLIESVADYQKEMFHGTMVRQNKWIQHGLWRYSRHPNYFGEILCWTGVYISAHVVLGRRWSALIAGPATAVALIVFTTGAPLLDQLNDKKWGAMSAYRAYCAATSWIVPWVPHSAEIAGPRGA